MSIYTEWFQGRGADEEERQQRCYLRRIVLVVLLFIFTGWALFTGKVYAQMHERVALIVIVFSPDGNRYQDFVCTFASDQECQNARGELLKHAIQQYGKESYVYSICTKAKSLGAVEV